MQRALLIGFLALLVLVGGYIRWNESTPTPQTVAIGGAFTLTNHLGEPVSDATYRGKPMLVYFGFTHCPDVCPTGLASMQAALEEMRDDAPVGLFITVDPERDTVKKLSDYMKNFPAITGLTGEPEQIEQVAKAFKVYYKKVENKDSPQDYTVDHTGLIYLMDAEGKYLAHFPHSIRPDELVARIQRSLS